MQWRQCSWARPSLNRWKPRALTRHCHSRPIESSKALRKDTVEDCCWKWKLQCTSGRNKRAVMSIGEQIFVTTRDYPLKNGPLKSHPCCPSQLGIRWHSRFQKRHCSTQIRRITSNMKMPAKHLHATWSSVLKGGLLQSLSQLISEIPVTVFTFPIVSLSIHKLERWLVHLAPETLAMPVCVCVLQAWCDCTRNKYCTLMIIDVFGKSSNRAKISWSKELIANFENAHPGVYVLAGIPLQLRDRWTKPPMDPTATKGRKSTVWTGKTWQQYSCGKLANWCKTCEKKISQGYLGICSVFCSLSRSVSPTAVTCSNRAPGILRQFGLKDTVYHTVLGGSFCQREIICVR